MNEVISYKLYSSIFFVLFLISYIISLKYIMYYFGITNSFFYPVSFFVLLGGDYVISAIFFPKLSLLAKRMVILLLMLFIVSVLWKFLI